MLRPSRRNDLLAALALVVVVVAGSIAALWFVGSSPADADQPRPATFSVEHIATSGSGPFTVPINLDPGTSTISAVTIALDYDDTTLRAVDCELNVVGACGLNDGHVTVSAFTLRGFSVTQSFALVTFEHLGEPTASALTLSVETVADVDAQPIRVVLVDGSIDIVEADGGITGDVVDASSNVGLYDLDVCAAMGAATPTCTTTSTLGTFLIEGLASGEYTLTVSDPTGAYGDASTTVAVQSPDVTTGLVVELEPSSTPPDDDTDGDTDEEPGDAEPGDAADSLAISGAVTDASGAPVFGAQVCAIVPVVLDEVCVFTGMDGAFGFDGLTIGSYVVVLSDPVERYAAAEPVVVGLDGAVADTRLDLAFGD